MLGQTRLAAHKSQLGQMLVASNIIDNKSLDEALHVSMVSLLPLGRVLTMSGKLKESDLTGLLQAQKLARQGSVPIESMVILLHNAHMYGVAYDEALLRQGWVNTPANTQTCFAPEECNSDLQDDPRPPTPIRAIHQPSQQDCLETLHLLQDACYALTVDEIGSIDHIFFDIALRCQELISDGFVSRSNAMYALACYNNSHKLKRSRNPQQGMGIRNLTKRLTTSSN